MLHGTDALVAAQMRADEMPIDDIDVLDLSLWQTDTMYPYFARLRRDDPVHRHPEGQHRDGPFWSITRFDDIVAIETDHEAFSSEPTIHLDQPVEGVELPQFIAMDPPTHTGQRKAVSPRFAPSSLAAMEETIRARIAQTLDELPIGEPFDWVDRVSIELTAQMLATLLDVPMEDRRKLTFWSDVTTTTPEAGLLDTTDFEAEWARVMIECGEYFASLWAERLSTEPRDDLISMMAHDPATRDMDEATLLGNMILLIVGGNDTTRNSMSGSVFLMDRNPDQRVLLGADPSLIPSMVSETIRWQTPLPYMRRTAVRDVEFRGKQIAAGDRLAMWYLSGNRDESAIDHPDEYRIDRPRVRHHLSFGFGIHRCVGNRLAEMQLRILWEEILQRFDEIHVTDVTHVASSFIHGYASMETVIAGRR